MTLIDVKFADNIQKTTFAKTQAEVAMPTVMTILFAIRRTKAISSDHGFISIGGLRA